MPRELMKLLVRTAGALLLATSGAALSLAAETGGKPELEYRVKAAFLLNFAKFVEWPADDSPMPAPVTICVIGDDPFGTTLDELVQGEAVGSRRIVVQRYPKPPEEKCSVAFIAGSGKEAGAVLTALGPGVLTVGDGEKFLREGGMIAFVIDNRRVRFDVNQSAARSGSVRLSSRLLSVARSVEK